MATKANEIVMTSQNETHRQAIVLARMGKSEDDALAVAKARRWHGKVRARFLSAYRSAKFNANRPV